MNGDPIKKEPMVVLGRYEVESQAEYHREMLNNAGIAAVIDDERRGPPPEPQTLPYHGGPILLRVPESEAKKAGEVLQEGFDDQMGSNPYVE